MLSGSAVTNSVASNILETVQLDSESNLKSYDFLHGNNEEDNDSNHSEGIASTHSLYLKRREETSLKLPTTTHSEVQNDSLQMQAAGDVSIASYEGVEVICDTSVLPSFSTCSGCNRKFKEARYLSIHQKRLNCGIQKAKPADHELSSNENNEKVSPNNNTVDASRSFKCTICTAAFLNKRSLSGHMRMVHRVVSPRSCGICGLVFYTTGSFKEHAMQHKGRVWKCDHCNKNFKTSKGFRYHQATLNVIKTFQCNKCEKKFVTEAKLNGHMSAHLACRYCGKMYKRRQGATQHEWVCDKRDPQNSRNFSCASKRKFVKVKNIAIESRSTASKYVILDNEMENDDQLVKLATSDIINRVVSQFVSFSNIKLSADDLVCSQINRNYSHDANVSDSAILQKQLPSDILNYDQVENVKAHTITVKFCCDRCGLICSSRSSHRSHLRRHGSNKPHHCHVCAKRFFSNRDLKVHLQVHEKIKRCFCEICGKGLSTVGVLKVHMGSHSSEKNFKCPYCFKAFRTSSLLKCHRKRGHKCMFIFRIVSLYSLQYLAVEYLCNMHELILSVM